MSTIERSGWTTSCEIRFIDERLAGNRRKLQGYLDGCARRADWGSVDPNQVILHAQEVLAQAEKTAEFVRGWIERHGEPA